MDARYSPKTYPSRWHRSGNINTASYVHAVPITVCPLIAIVSVGSSKNATPRQPVVVVAATVAACIQSTSVADSTVANVASARTVALADEDFLVMVSFS